MHIKTPPDIVVGRLPIYLRALDALAQEDYEIASSHELGKRLGMSSAQIRKDLSLFGDFGKQGTGYQIQYLIEQLRNILQLDREWEMVLIGAGHMGKALANYPGFAEHGFKITAIFDNDPTKVNQKEGALTIHPVQKATDYIREHDVKFAMIATPASVAQEIADLLVEAGIQSILNYAPLTLVVPEDVHVQYIDPVSGLQHMAYYIRDKQQHTDEQTTKP